jgi:CheY-like chemotaxis protein
VKEVRVTILSVDDDPMVFRFCIDILAGMSGLHVLKAGSGIRALDVATRHPGAIDLLVSDISMPGGISGIEVTEQLALFRPESKALLMAGFSPWVERVAA